jgi:hypothetical protein
MHVLQPREHALLVQPPAGDAGFERGLEDERQFENLHLGELARRVAREHPGDIRDAVLHELELLERILAEGAAPEALQAHLVADLCLNGLHPGLDDLETPKDCSGTKEAMRTVGGLGLSPDAAMRPTNAPNNNFRRDFIALVSSLRAPDGSGAGLVGLEPGGDRSRASADRQRAPLLTGNCSLY